MEKQFLIMPLFEILMDEKDASLRFRKWSVRSTSFLRETYSWKNYAPGARRV